jgi:hypothetical protein
MTKIADWLVNWHRTTATIRPLKREQLEQALVSTCDRLASYLQNAEEYRNLLIARGGTVVGNPIPFVATHNDLSMANILLDEHNQLGVVDWETGCLESWPLVDFFYAVTDAVRIAANCRDWLDAFKACYVPGGVYRVPVVAWQQQLQSAVGVSPGFAELCFHACWLHHAWNEHQVSQSGEPRPFLEIVQWLASHELKFHEIHD